MLMQREYSIRFAAAPVGALRWQAPQPPPLNRSYVIMADTFGSQCPQSPPALLPAALLPGVVNWTVASEDCLFLNIYAPSNATNLPVLVWIHGGGYGFGNGQENLSAIVSANNNGFIGVSIQYRVGYTSRLLRKLQLIFNNLAGGFWLPLFR